MSVIRIAKKILRPISSFLLVFVIFLSGFPSEALLQVLRDRNVVDMLWQASRDGEVVDRFFTPETAHAETVEDMIAYRGGADTSRPVYRRHNNTDGFGSESLATDAVGVIEWLRLEADPTGSDEKVMCTKDTVDTLDCEVWNGLAWGNFQEMEAATIGDVASRSFDICYEQTSGDAFVYYSDVGTDASIIYYRFWNGSAWSDQTALVDTAETIQTIRCVPELGTDYIAIMAKGLSDGLYAAIWDGSSVVDHEEIEAGASATDSAFSYHGAWESNRGDFIAAFYADVDHAIDGKLWDRSAVTFFHINDIVPAAQTSASETTHIEVRANPDSSSNEIIVVSHDNANTIDYNVWNGTTWAGATTLATSYTILTSGIQLALAYEHKSFDAMLVYGTTTTNVNYRVFSSGSFGDETAMPTGLLENPDWLQLAADPHSDRIMLISAGATNDVDAIEWSGSAWDASWTEIERTSDDVSQNVWFTYDYEDEEAGASAPTVGTRPATNVGASSANVHGALVSDGGASITEHGFAYSTSANLTTNTATTTLGALSVAEFSQATTTLSATVTYYFRAYATNSSGTGLGAISSFTTGNATVARKMRLFEGSTTRLLEGRIRLLGI